MRDKYYTLLKEKNLPDIFQKIPELSYSEKIKFLSILTDSYDSKIVSHALNEYRRNYIESNRVSLKDYKWKIISICEVYKKKLLTN